MDIKKIDNILENIVKPIYKQYYDIVFNTHSNTEAKQIFKNKYYVDIDTGELYTQNLGRLFSTISRNPAGRVYVAPSNIMWYSNDKHQYIDNGVTTEFLSHPIFTGNISGQRKSLDNITSDFGVVYRVVVQRFLYVKQMYDTNQYISSSSYDNSEYIIDIDRVSQDIYTGYTSTTTNNAIIPFDIYIEAMYLYYFIYLMYLNTAVVKILDGNTANEINRTLINEYRETISKFTLVYSAKAFTAIEEYEKYVKHLTDINSEMATNKSIIDLKIRTLNNITDADKSKDWIIYITVLIAIMMLLGLVYVNRLTRDKQLLFSSVLIIILMVYYIAMYFYFDYAIADIEGFAVYNSADDIKFNNMMDKVVSYIKKKHEINLIDHVVHNGLKSETELYDKLNDTLHLNIKKVDSSLNDSYINIYAKKELMNLIIYLTLLVIVIYVISSNVDMKELTFGISIILLTVIIGMYFYNTNINERRNYLKKYWNHQYSYKTN